MSAIAATIKAVQASEDAKKLEAAACDTRRAAVIESGKLRCAALIDDFNTTPMRLRYATDVCGRNNTLSLRTSHYSWAVFTRMPEMVKLGMRAYLCWKAEHLICGYNSERCHVGYCSWHAEMGPRNQEVLNNSTRMLTYEEFVTAIQARRHSLAGDGADNIVVGWVLPNGKFTTGAPYNSLGSLNPEAVFDYPGDFIAAVIRPMAQFFEVVEAPVMKTPFGRTRKLPVKSKA